MISSLLTAWLLSAAPAAAADRCSIELPRPPRLVVSRDFSPEPETCVDPLLPRCRTRTTFREDEPTVADYRLTCSERRRRPAPSPKAKSQDPPLLQAVRSGPWIDGVAIIVPADSRCVPLAGVATRLGRNFPNLVAQRTVPPEKEPRLRVWTLTVDNEGFPLVTGLGQSKPVRGPETLRLPDAVCRGSFELDGKRTTPRTRTIVATCRGTPRPSVTDGCGDRGGDIIWSDLRRLVAGSGNDPGTAHLKVLAATDEEVRQLSQPPPPKPAPPPAPVRPSRTCEEGPKPVPLDQIVAEWSGSQRTIEQAVEAGAATSCAVHPTDLDPDGLVLALATRTIDDAADRELLAELWRSDEGLGSALLAALNPEGGAAPALRAPDLGRLATTALEDRRALELTRRTVDEYEASRQRLTEALDRDRAALAELDAGTAETLRALDELEGSWSDWPPHAGDRLAELERQRERVGTALRSEALRDVDRRAGNGVALEMIKLVGRIEDDPVYQVRQEARDIRAALTEDAPAALEACRGWLEETAAEISAPMTLEEAIDRPEAFRLRRDVVAELERRLEDGPCRASADLAEALDQRVRNLAVSAGGLAPWSNEHPRVAVSKRLERRSERWLRGIASTPPTRLSVGLTRARRRSPEAPTRLGVAVGVHGTLWHRGPTILGVRVVPALRQRLGEPSDVRMEAVVPADLFLGLGPAWRDRTVVQPQVHVGAEVRLPWFGQEVPVRGAGRVGGGLWLQPSRKSGHGLYVDGTLTLRPTDGPIRRGGVFELGYVYQWSRRTR